jgi:biopolymer transport protein ExbD
MRHSRRGRLKLAAMDQINVTPLLDLTFLLLIAFMITMPIMEYGTNVKVPEMNSDDLPIADNDRKVKNVTLTRDNKIMLDDQEVSREELIAELAQLKNSGDKVDLMLRADGERSYKDVIELMAEIRRGGFTDVTLVTNAEQEPR